jgi:Tol biopolymer transport system component
VASPSGRSGRALAGIIGALALSAPEPVFLTVRQADRYATPLDVVAPSVSADGRYVAFASLARLVPEDTNKRSDIYVLDRVSGTVTVESLAPDGRASTTDSISPRISGDGRFVVYESMEEGSAHVFLRVITLRDRRRATTRIFQRAQELPDRSSREPTISSDGRTVVFSTGATNLGEGFEATRSAEDVYAFRTSTDRFERINVGTDGRPPTVGASFSPSVSSDGRYIAFTSTSDLDGSAAARQPRPRMANVYLRDTEAHVTRRISVGRDGAIANGPSYAASISGDGRRIAFVSEATNLASRDDNRFPDIFLYDVESRTTLLVSRSASGGSANGPSRSPAISANGHYVAFQSNASDLTCSGRCSDALKDINLVSDVFRFDCASRTTARLSTAGQPWMEPSAAPSISGTGSVVAFSSRHPVDANDTQNDFDLFVWMDQTLSLTYRARVR